MTWKDLTGYFWPYRISENAIVQRYDAKKDKWITVNHFVTSHNYGSRCIVRMKLSSGTFKNMNLKYLMRDTFLGGVRPGYGLINKNGMSSDCAIYNLKFVTMKESSHRSGGGLRRSIEKVDPDGNIICLYSSVTDAAKHEFVGRKAITMRCENLIQEDPFKLTGYNYRYEEGVHKHGKVSKTPSRG